MSPATDRLFLLSPADSSGKRARLLQSPESGMDLGPWLRHNDITIVSTVPTLVALWPASALDDVRLLILGRTLSRSLLASPA